MTKEYPLVEVFWEDAWSIAEPTPFDNPMLAEPILRRSVGYLLKTKPFLLLCASPFEGFEKGQDFTGIPKKLVTKMRELKSVEED